MDAAARPQLHRSRGGGRRWRGPGRGFTGSIWREGMSGSVGGQVPGSFTLLYWCRPRRVLRGRTGKIKGRMCACAKS